MAITLLKGGESGRIRPGDAVFYFDPAKEKFQLHVGIYIGEDQAANTPSQSFWVQGIPDQLDGEWLGDSYWGQAKNYQVHFIGQRLDVDPANVKEVALISSAMRTELNRLGIVCPWKRKMLLHATKTILGGIPLFLQGTCGQYVEYLYDNAGLDLIDEAVTYSPEPRDRGRINPATQLHVFWAGAYGLRTTWDLRYKRCPDCMFGTRSVL
jgi:hypothetical protein